MSSSLSRRFAAALSLLVSAAASSAPLTLAPGESFGITNVSTSTPYSYIALYADIADIQSGDSFFTTVFSGVDGTGDPVGNGGTLDGKVSEVTNALITFVSSDLLRDGSFSFDFGTTSTSASGLTFGNVRVVLVGSTVADELETIPVGVQAVPEPGTLALAAGALLAAGLVRRKRD